MAHKSYLTKFEFWYLQYKVIQNEIFFTVYISVMVDAIFLKITTVSMFKEGNKMAYKFFSTNLLYW